MAGDKTNYGRIYKEKCSAVPKEVAVRFEQSVRNKLFDLANKAEQSNSFNEKSKLYAKAAMLDELLQDIISDNGVFYVVEYLDTNEFIVSDYGCRGVAKTVNEAVKVYVDMFNEKSFDCR